MFANLLDFSKILNIFVGLYTFIKPNLILNDSLKYFNMGALLM